MTHFLSDQFPALYPSIVSTAEPGEKLVGLVVTGMLQKMEIQGKRERIQPDGFTQAFIPIACPRFPLFAFACGNCCSYRDIFYAEDNQDANRT